MSSPVTHRYPTLRATYIALAAGLVLFVTWGLLAPAPLRVLRGTSLAWVRHLHNVGIHLCVYGTVTVVLLPLVTAHRRGIQRLLIGCIACHAVVTELLQAFIPQRTCDPVDLLANMLGIAVGLRIVQYFRGSFLGAVRRTMRSATPAAAGQAGV